MLITHIRGLLNPTYNYPEPPSISNEHSFHQVGIHVLLCFPVDTV